MSLNTKSETNPQRKERLLLFILSLAMLSFEVVLVRIFSYSLNPALVYMSISMALLGIGLSGTVLAIFPRLRDLNLIRTLAICHLLFAASTVVASSVFAHLSQLTKSDYKSGSVISVLPLLLLFAVPFFISGMAIALVLVSNAREVGRNYFVNLIGSAAGCFAIYPVLSWLGAERVVVAIALLCAVCGSIAAAKRARRWLPFGVMLCILLIGCWFYPNRVLGFQPDPTDLLANVSAQIEKIDGKPQVPETVFTRWDPVGRIDLVRLGGRYRFFGGSAPAFLFVQDAGAGSVLLGLKKHPELAEIYGKSSIYGLATSLRRGGEVAVIGLGGGPDLVASLAAGAGKVTGVDVNRAVIDLLGERYRDQLGLEPTNTGKTRLVHADGRAFLRRNRDRFDVIQMTGTDTFTANAASGSLLSENHLYTVEALSDYFRALKPGGILAISRFVTEELRTLTTLVAGLEDAGIRQPLKHMIVVRQGPILVSTLVKKDTPFSRDEILQFVSSCQKSRELSHRLSLPIFEVIGCRIDKPMVPVFHPLMPHEASDELSTGADQKLGNPYQTLIAAVQTGTLDQWLNSRDLDLSPPTDDRPFFFHFPRVSWPAFADFFRPPRASRVFAWDARQYIIVVFQISVISLLLILVPLAILKRRGLSVRHAPMLGLYFFSIGTGFMLIEIGFMQKLSLLLGHPNHAISTVLFSMLFFSGLGSVASRYWTFSLRIAVRVAAVVVILCTVISSSLKPGDFLTTIATSSIGLRIAVVMALLSVPSFFLGTFFPIVFGFVEKHSNRFAPWAFGVNGFASIVGSLAAIPISVAFGYTLTLLLGAGAYLLAWLSVEVLPLRNWNRNS